MTKKKISLTTQLLVALLIGGVLGVVLQGLPDSFVKNDIIIDGVLWALGTAFLNAIRMVVVPLVFISLVSGMASMTDIKQFGRIGGKTLLWYVFTTPIAIGLAMGLATIVNPSRGVSLADQAVGEANITASAPIHHILVNIIPSNPFAAFSSGEMLQVIFFAMIWGTAMILLGDGAKPVKDVIDSANDIILKVVEIIMKFAPFGAFALISRAFAQIGIQAIGALLVYMLCVFGALILQSTVVYGGMLKLVGGKDPTTGKRLSLRIFLKKMLPTISFAFASSSSGATIPITKKSADDLGVHDELSSFSIPLGSTFNMDGTAIMQGVAVVFLSGLYGVNLGVQGLIVVMITATMSTIGTAGVPGAGMIMLALVLTSVGIPTEGIAIILGVDRILDMSRTVTNVCGDVVASVIIANSEGLLDHEQYNKV